MLWMVGWCRVVMTVMWDEDGRVLCRKVMIVMEGWRCRDGKMVLVWMV